MQALPIKFFSEYFDNPLPNILYKTIWGLCGHTKHVYLCLATHFGQIWSAHGFLYKH